MTVVVNKRRHKPTPEDVYIGRPSKFGNPFAIGQDGDRAAVIAKYEEWLRGEIEGNRITRDDLASLRGKCLVCWCAPAACHGDVLKRYAEGC